MTIFKVTDRSALKPIYIVIVEDLTEKNKLCYYKAQEFTETSNYLEIRSGVLLTKLQAENLSVDPYAKNNAKTEVNRKIPWHRIIRMDNITYKTAKLTQGE